MRVNIRVLTLVMVVILCLCGCQHNELPSDSSYTVNEESVIANPNDGAFLDKTIVEGIYRETEYSLPDDWTIPFGFFPESDPDTEDTAFLVTRYDAGNECDDYGILTCDSSGVFGDVNSLYCPENGRIQQAVRYQALWLYTVTVNDPETMQTECRLLSQPIIQAEENPDPVEKQLDIFPRFLSVDSDGDIYLADQYNIQILTPDLDTRTVITLSPQEGWIKAMGRLPDGKVYICSNRNGWKISPVEKEGAALGDGTEISFNPVSVVFRDSGEYALYVQTDSGVDAYSFDGSLKFEKELINFMKSGIVIPVSNLPVEYVPGTVLVGIGLENQLWFRRSVDDVSKGFPVLMQPSDVVISGDAYLLRLAYINEPEGDVKTAIAAYAASHPEVTLILEDYTPSGPNGGSARLLMNLVTGTDCPDLIIGDCSNPDFLAIRDQKLYTDLAQYVRNDPEINDNTIFGCILGSFSTEKEGLWALPKSFSFLAYLSTDDYLAEYVDRGSWTVSEMVSWLEALPEGSLGMEELSQMQAGLFFMLGADEFIRDDSCEFDSEAFLPVLRYLNGLPDSYESWGRITGWDGMSEQEKAQKRIEGSIRLVFENIPQMRSVVGFSAVYGTEDWRLIGFPTVEDSGIVVNTQNAMLITKYNVRPDESWEFIKSIVSAGQDAVKPESQFPILKESFARVMSVYDDIQITAYPDLFGCQEDVYDPDIPEDPLIKANGGIIYRFDQAARTRIMESLDLRCGPIKNNDDIINIILEEISGMTAGHSSPEECVRIISSRVSIMLAERQ